jgi:hypothetical protein
MKKSAPVGYFYGEHPEPTPTRDLADRAAVGLPDDARRLKVLAALILAMVQARSVVLYTLKTHVQLPGSLDTRYQRLRRQFPEHLFARFAVSFLPDGEVHLILDRTNSKLGSQNVNVLLSVVWDGFSLPLMWTLLPHGGCSSQPVREELLTWFLQCCPERSVSSLLADREFIGKSWFTFLSRHGVALVSACHLRRLLEGVTCQSGRVSKSCRSVNSGAGTAKWSSMVSRCGCAPRRMPLEKCCTWRTLAMLRSSCVASSALAGGKPALSTENERLQSGRHRSDVG